MLNNIKVSTPRECPGVIMCKVAGEITASVIFPEKESDAARLVFARDRVSLTRLLKEASDMYQSGKLLTDTGTRFMGVARPEMIHGEFIKRAGCVSVIVDQLDNRMVKVAARLSKEQEMELWRRYKQNGDKQALRELMHSFKPLVISRVRPWTKNSPLPKSAVEAQGMKLLREGIDSYDPSKGAALNTHIWYRLGKIHRYGYTYQNVGSLPEPRAAKVGVYQNTYEILKDQKKREPTLSELQEALGWKMSDIKAIQKELRQDLILDSTLGPISATNTDPAVEALFMTYHEGTPQQQLIMEHTFDEFDGKETLSGPKEIANRLNISESTVRNENRQIANSIRDILSANPWNQNQQAL